MNTGSRHSTCAHSAWPLIVATAALVAAAGGSAGSQEEPAQRFEIVSLRRVPPPCAAFELSLRCERQSPPPTTFHMFAGGRLEFTNQPAIDLVRIAYGLEGVSRDLVTGGPGWLRSERYELIAMTGVDGIAGDQASESLTQEIRMMLRSLLAERFKLRVRVHPKRENVLRLQMVDPNRLGPRIGPARGDCPHPPPDSQVMSFSGCVFLLGGQVHASNITTTDLLQILAVPSRLPLRDGTGLTARYDVRFTPLRTVKQDSLARELGLELMPVTLTLDGLRIEGAERPMDD